MSGSSPKKKSYEDQESFRVLEVRKLLIPCCMLNTDNVMTMTVKIIQITEIV